MWRAVALILLCLVTFVAGLGQSAITDSDEAFYAESGREMVESGDWITPHYNYEPRLQKPILFYWLIASTYLVAGVSEWAARLWSGLAGLGLALVAAAVARRWLGAANGTLAGAIVATSFGVVPLARQALPDVPLAFFVSVTIWAAIEALSVVPPERKADTGTKPLRRATWLYISSVAAGLGMLTKGPVALVLPVTVLIPLIWWERRQPAGTRTAFALSSTELINAAAIFVVVAARWYLAVMRAQGFDYARQFFVGENVERFATSTYNSWRGWQYLPVIVAGLLPWSAFFLLWIRPVGDWMRKRRSLTPLEARLVAWTGGPLLFFMVSVGSQPRYILPCLLPLSVLLARTVSLRARSQAPEGRRAFMVSAVVGAVMIALTGTLLWRAAVVLGGEVAPAAGPLIVIAIGVAAIVAVIVLPRRLTPLVLAGAAALSLVAFQSSLLSPGRPEPVEVVASAIRAEPLSAGVCACGAFARTLSFYTGMRTEVQNVTPERTDELELFLSTSARVFAAVDARALAAVEASRGTRFPRLTEVTYLNLHEWQRGEVLVRPDPAWAQRVVLISNR